MTDWSITHVARIAGTTSRALRHYGEIGLLEPSRIGSNGYRYYDAAALTRLQRILLLRELGLALPAIAEALAAHDDSDALSAHLDWLESEKSRIDRQIASVRTTIRKRSEGAEPMADEMFDGFDHTRYRQEVSERWGSQVAADSSAWWESKHPAQRSDFTKDAAALAQAWADAAASGLDPTGPEARSLAARQFAWLASVPGTPGYPDGPTREYWLGLADLYVSDERFAANYGGVEGASFVRDAMVAFTATD